MIVVYDVALYFPLAVTGCFKCKWCGTLGTSGEFLEGHDQLGTLGITNKLLGVAPLELQGKYLKGTTKLGNLGIIKNKLIDKYNQEMKTR